MNAYFAEFLGTFIFVSIILLTGNPYAIAFTLLVVILLTVSISGGHINPAVSTAMLLNKSINFEKYIGYVFSQLLGAILAYFVYVKVK